VKLVIGIDEAGFGPRLGPLVIAASAFATPDDVPARELYQRLRGPLCRARSKRPGERLVVDDSKQVYHFGQDLALLEAPLLAFLACRETGAATCLGEFFHHQDSLYGDLRAHPWYDAEFRRRPLGQPDGAAVERLNHAFARHEMRFLGFAVTLVLEAEWNVMWHSLQNKAAVHASLVLKLLARMLEELSWTGSEVHIDRLGGRVYYEGVLAATFPLQPLRAVRERPQSSSYELRLGGRPLSVGFHTHGDARYLPIALSSMAAKYLREQFMGDLNRYFGERLPGLRPTAGYYGDGTRFVNEIAPLMPALGLDRTRLVRVR
jgi:ribonuclease HII